MSTFKTLKNITAIPQSVVHKGRQHVLNPLDEQNFDSALADVFLSTCGGAVQDTTDDIASAYSAPSDSEKYMWIANMTGNPDAPKEVYARVADDKGRTSKQLVPNTNLQPRDLTCEVHQGHEQWFGEDGALWQRSLPPKVVRLPMKRRVRVEREIAEQMLIRDARAMCRGAVVKSREPSTFEPSIKWPVNDIRAFFRLVDPIAQVGEDEEHLKVKAAAEGVDAGQLTLSAKRDLLNRLFYRLVDPRYRLPTRAEFDEFVTGKSTQEVAREEIEELLESSDKNSKRGLRKLGQ